MSAIRNHVLVVGATSGIGAGLARRIHAQGKKVIATGRRQDRLSALANELPGLETSRFDIRDVAALPSAVANLTGKYPGLDTVIVSAAIQGYFSVKDPDSSSPRSIAEEVATNLTAPIVLCRLLVPFFLQSNKPCSIVLIGSGFSFVPVPSFPVYCPTKAGLHSFSVALRADLAGTNVSVTELLPPYVATELDVKFKDTMMERLGGPDRAPPAAMPVEDFVEQAMKGLEESEDGKPKREVAIGHFSEMVTGRWREAYGPALTMFHVDG